MQKEALMEEKQEFDYQTPCQLCGGVVKKFYENGRLVETRLVRVCEECWHEKY